MLWLAREVKRLIHLDPSLCEQIYYAVFSYEEKSNEETSIGSSRILPLTSTRRQDYGMACYQLGEVFSEFLSSASENAIRALITVMNNYVVQHHSAPHHGEQTKEFGFDGLKARIQPDFSVSWDAGDIYRHDDPVKMLDAFERHLEELSGQQGSIDNICAYVRLLVLDNRTSVLWRRVLQVASKHPTTLGRVILPVSWAIPILTGYDTSHAAGEFLKAITPGLESASRERIERAILSIPNTVTDERRKSAESVRNRLLGCLSGAEFIISEARQLFEQLKANANLPTNTPPIRHGAVWSKAYGEEDYLREQGVPVEAEANHRIRELEAPVKEFASRHLNSPPTQEENLNLLPSLKTLHDLLAKKDNHIHPKQSSYAWGPLAEACVCIATTDGLTPNDPSAAFAKLVLLEASLNPEPTPDPESDAQFDDSPSWGTPAPRVESAQGLIALVRNESFATDEVLEAIERLSDDADSMIWNAKSLQRVANELERKESGPPQKDSFLFWGISLASPILLSLATEIALKAWQCRERKGKPEKTHDLLRLFEVLESRTQERLEARMRKLSPHSVWAEDPRMQNLNEDLQDIFRACRHPLRNVLCSYRDAHTHWRFIHEDPNGMFETAEIDRALTAIIDAYVNRKEDVA